MARYERDWDQARWSGNAGQGGFGSRPYARNVNRYGDNYRGMGGYGSGGGPYDDDLGPGYGGSGFPGVQPRDGRGSDRYGFGGHGIRESEPRQGRGSRGGGDYYGATHGEGSGYTDGYGGQSYGGGWTGGASTGRDRSYGGSIAGGGDEVRRMRAADVMTDDPECVTPDTSLADAARRMRDLDVGIIPVVESDTSKRLRGVLTDRDIAIRAVAAGKDAGTTRVMEVMSTQVETCNENDSLRDVLSVMEREQVRRVPSTDRDGRLVGIIAQADVATEVSSPQGQRRFADAVEHISEPGSPRSRGGSGGRARQGRGSGSSRTGTMRGTAGTQGNDDPRALRDRESENV